MSVTDLKAKAYDILAQIQYLQNVLQETNKQIQEMSKPQEVPKEEASA